MRKLIGYLSLVTAVLTALWVALLIAGMANTASAQDFDHVLANVSRLDTVYYAGYLNAAMITVAATMLYAVLYGYFKHESPAWALIAVLFVPVFCTLNLVVYLSQITLVPNLLAVYGAGENRALAVLLLRESIQQYPASTVSLLNNLAYALLGIPSIIFGLLLLNHRAQARSAGILLALNGIACILGLGGVLFKFALLSLGSVIGGVLFLAALIPLGLAFLSGESGMRPSFHLEAELRMR